jgi:cysteine desulfurase/selenocysteine lyase
MSLSLALTATEQTDQIVRGDGLDLSQLRREFPALLQAVHGKPLVYLDNAATAQKPRAVLDALAQFYETDNANVHRGVHTLGDRSTVRYEQARARVQKFLNARSPREIIFVRGATEGINLVAQCFGRRNIGPGDEVIITWMEHHANIVPWQLVCEEKGASLRVVPITDSGELRLGAYEKMLSPRTKLVAISHVSNVLGTVNPVKRMIEMAHRKGIPVLVDGAQAVSHLDVDVQSLDCDFYAFSGHKLYGPMGIGVLYGKSHHLEAMPPWQGGGDMVQAVTFARTTFSALPFKFEAGTPNVAGAVGLAAALDELDRVGRDAIAAHEANLVATCVQQLKEIPGLRLIGEPAHRAGVVSFVIEDRRLSALDVGTRLDLEGIAVRTGHHCCQPLMQRLGVAGTVRASFGLYNTIGEVERLSAVLRSMVLAEPAARSRDSAPQRAVVLEPEAEYPAAAAGSVEEAAAALLDDFEGLDDWSERYQYVIELGRNLSAMPRALKTEANRIRGCQSIVFLFARTLPDSPEVVEFLADSESEIVRGLIALLQHLFSGQRAGEILDFDLPGFLTRIGLATNLTMSRRNGLNEMIRRLREHATDVCRTTADALGWKSQGGCLRPSLTSKVASDELRVQFPPPLMIGHS